MRRAANGAEARPRRQRGWWYPWIFVAIMLVVVAVNGIMATLAVRTFPGLQTEDAYNKGLRYNETLAAAREQSQRGWQMTAEMAPASAVALSATETGREAEVKVTFVDREGYPLERLEIEAMLVRPTAKGYDRPVALSHRGGGVYAGTVLLPLAGQWDARIVARRDSDTFQTTRRLFIP